MKRILLLLVLIVVNFMSFNLSGCARRDAGSDTFPACTTPSSLSAAVSALYTARPCWAWIEQQAQIATRIAQPSFKKGLAIDPTYITGGEAVDHTAEIVAFADTMLTTHNARINMAPHPQIAPPWADSSGTEYRFPYSATVLDEKLRGLATMALYAKSKGRTVNFTIMLGPGWEADLMSVLTSSAALSSWLTGTFIPQLKEYARIAELVKAEEMDFGSAEIDIFFLTFPALRRLSAADQLIAAQSMIDQSYAAIRTYFTGEVYARMTVSYPDQATARTAYNDNALNMPDWTTLDLSDYSKLSLTLKAHCDDASSWSPVASVQLPRVTSLLANNIGKPWFIGELLMPGNCSNATTQANAYDTFFSALNAYESDGSKIDPVGLRGDQNPTSNSAELITPQGLAKITNYLDAH